MIIYGIYINNHSLISPVMGVYPTLELIAEVIRNITGCTISSREISNSMEVAGMFVYKNGTIEIAVTEVSKELIDLCSKYDGTPIRIRTELLNRRLL